MSGTLVLSLIYMKFSSLLPECATAQHSQEDAWDPWISGHVQNKLGHQLAGIALVYKYP